MFREVVERRAHIVTGRKPTEAEVDNMIDTGESETIFQKAILEQGRGHVSLPLALRCSSTTTPLIFTPSSFAVALLEANNKLAARLLTQPLSELCCWVVLLCNLLQVPAAG